MQISIVFSFVVLLDVIIEPRQPTPFGAAGAIAGVGIVLAALAVGAGFFLLARKALSARVRIAIAGVLTILSVAAGVGVWALARSLDLTERRRYERELDRNRQRPSRPIRRNGGENE